MEFDKPWVYENKWNVFDDTILTNLDLSDCANTINGFCERADTVKECIKKCQDAPEKNCSHGYFIETPDNYNYCVPLRDHVETTFPYHRLRQKNYYPIMKDMNTYFFANKDVYPFPPFHPNMMFYRDNFILKHKRTGLNIGTGDDTLTQNVIFSKDTSVYIQIVPKNISRSKVDDYIAVKNGDEIVINIPGTAFVLHRTGDDKILWQLGVTNTNAHENVLQIYAKGRKDGEILSFDDDIYFTSFKDIPDGFFTTLPKVEVSYCDNGVCKKISLDQADLKGYEAYYKGKRIYRSFCWIDCGNGTQPFYRRWWVVIALIVLLFIVLYFKKLLVFK
jgi:hypothetical protein